MRLSKRDVEALLATYDTNPEAALTTALGRVLRRPDLGFDALVDLAAFPTDRTAALLARRTDALDGLARELNEDRRLPPATR